MDYSAANMGLWNPIIQIGIISVMILISNVLRSKLPLVKKSLMPTAVLAGFLLLGFKYLNWIFVDEVFLGNVTYHALGIGFIALSLRVNKVGEKSASGFMVAVRSGATIVSTYLIQGLTGLIISIGLAYTFMPDFFKAAGLLLPMGYGQGPGQANNIGSTYESLGFAGGRSFGLAIAATGFLVACIVGVIYLNVGATKGKFKRVAHNDISGSVTIDTFQDEGEIPVSQSIDKFSIQTALILIVYLFTYFFIWAVTALLAAKAPGVNKLLSPMLWGFNFIFGCLFAFLFKLILKGFRKTNIATHQMQNNYLLNRISGLAFDVMIVSGIATIDFEELSGLWLPFILIALAGGIVTFFYLKFMTKKLYPGYEEEGFLAMFGMLTGTISSGVLLAREIDPDFDTPAANNLVTGSSTAIFFGAPMLILVGLAAKSTAMCFTVFGILAIYFLILVFVALFKGKKKSAEAK